LRIFIYLNIYLFSQKYVKTKEYSETFEHDRKVKTYTLAAAALNSVFKHGCNDM